MVGLQSGEHVWTAALGFLITAWVLPEVITVIALARRRRHRRPQLTDRPWRRPVAGDRLLRPSARCLPRRVPLPCPLK